MVYTKEAETADQYIEKLAMEFKGEKDVTVATSDRIIQLIIMGQNCRYLSAGDFALEIQKVDDDIKDFIGKQ